ncbi:hypothetical protein A3F02_01620 [Candidatus Curtissbacteria bacterium RIFCSPHIGHO2_12_FULL_38_9b]|uniref:Transposase IS200-like domain-containing protein n=1 Tax=Candidatus Curtissbacteria bacterium RIFCSPHIGHO2_12_FULL_38_9b TaxID=1797720 RepID=A0A1F5GZV8_9BACT|nr:MAG: hypothetical protein A3F02_01620 [Candidatus Curtissbacteria bacterium RIFCSPHIGHO2_12_FULL_38_9b]
MPSKNSIKQYLENSYYHIYNRGVEKRVIFENDEDYKVFLSYLKIYLDPPQSIEARTVSVNNNLYKTVRRPLNNYYGEIELVTYCLMPNHFHLLIWQNKNPKSIEYFMRSLCTKYSQYFNKKYQRIGYLFQGTYKAVLIKDDSQLLHLTRYIHLNPTKETPLQKAYSSYADYLGKRSTSWVKPRRILGYFKTAQKAGLKDLFSYQSFVEDYQMDSAEVLGNLKIEE